MKLRDSETGNPILLMHLATHSSGLPRIPDNLDQSKILLDPYEYYNRLPSSRLFKTTDKISRDDLFDFLKTFHPVNVGKKYSYSNLGFAALAEVCTIVEKSHNFPKLVEDKILGKKPFHMLSATTIIRSSDIENVLQSA